jgi:hypothetical protein
MLKTAFLCRKSVLIAMCFALASCNNGGGMASQPPHLTLAVPNPTAGALASPTPVPISIHERQKALIKRIAKMSPEDAAPLVAQFAPSGMAPGPDPRKQLQGIVINTDDPQTLSRMEERFPQ